MPIKKPKPLKMPSPFARQELSEDDDARRRAILMKRELESAGGFSWNAQQAGFFDRIRNQPRHKLIAGVVSLGMAGAIVSAFLIGMDSGIEVPERLVYMESWSGNRTAKEAVDEREEAMDKLRAQIMENRRLYQEQLAREKALEAERAAARQATS
jgi:hypothetical protein